MRAPTRFEPLAGNAPQSLTDVEAVERELQALDQRLGLRWEPRAVMVQRGSYDAMGKVRAPVYAGRWEIALYDKAFSTAEWRPHTRICLVTELVDTGGVMAMAADGPYAPVGPWLVEFMRQADKHNQEGARRLQATLDAQNAAWDEAKVREGDAGTEEVLSRMFFEGTKEGGVSEFWPVKATLTGATQGMTQDGGGRGSLSTRDDT